MLHGYTQSGPLFRAKTRALEKNLAKAFPQGVRLEYPTAPLRLSPADLPDSPASPAAGEDAPEAFAWWRRRDPPPGAGAAAAAPPELAAYDGLASGLAAVARALRERGPFDGAVGFSQGGALAALVASLLEPGRAGAFAERRREAGAAAAAAEGDEDDDDGLPMAFPASFLAGGGAGGAGDRRPPAPALRRLVLGLRLGAPALRRLLLPRHRDADAALPRQPRRRGRRAAEPDARRRLRGAARRVPSGRPLPARIAARVRRGAGGLRPGGDGGEAGGGGGGGRRRGGEGGGHGAAVLMDSVVHGL